MLTAKRPALRTCVSSVTVSASETAIKGGASEIDMKALAVMPCSPSPAHRVVITVTPVTKWPQALRKSWESTSDTVPSRRRPGPVELEPLPALQRLGCRQVAPVKQAPDAAGRVHLAALALHLTQRLNGKVSRQQADIAHLPRTEAEVITH